jgi:dihydrofolate reductase
MDVPEEIKKYIASQPDQKRSEMQALHRIILQVMPACKVTGRPRYIRNGQRRSASAPFKADLVDALELMIIPITLGQGKRLFQHGTIPAAFKVTESRISPNGIVSATYERDGDVRTGAPQIEQDD